jgi:hypothetical protein
MQTSTNIYRQHEAAFANVSAYAVLQDGKMVATIAFKFPRDGAGRLYAYVHWIGTDMVRGYAAGGGYDKRSAACAHAASKMQGRREGRIGAACEVVWSKPDPMSPEHAAFRNALAKDDGHGWDRNLRDAGFDARPVV